MKCINSRVLCLFCIISLLLSGCGSNSQTTLTNSYNAYSYESSYLNTENAANTDYYAQNLCVTDTVNFGTEGTYYEVSKGAGVFNVTTNEVLFNYNMFDTLYPASTTKILTAYIIIRDCDLNDIVTISELAAEQSDDSSTCGLKAGDKISVNDLLYGLMLVSGNDAAEALAEHHSGSIEAFAEEMTRTAHSLGATNSNFKNPSGLPDSDHYTTVYDMYLLFNEAIKYDKFTEIISTGSQKVYYTSADGEALEKAFINHSRYYTGTVETPDGFTIVGGKTGTTYDAGYCLVLYSINPDGEDIISIVFKADGAHNLYLLMNEILSKYAK